MNNTKFNHNPRMSINIINNNIISPNSEPVSPQRVTLNTNPNLMMTRFENNLDVNFNEINNVNKNEDKKMTITITEPHDDINVNFNKNFNNENNFVENKKENNNEILNEGKEEDNKINLIQMNNTEILQNSNDEIKIYNEVRCFISIR